LLRWPRDTLYPLKWALTPPTSGGRSVGIVRFAEWNHGVCFGFCFWLFCNVWSRLASRALLISFECLGADPAEPVQTGSGLMSPRVEVRHNCRFYSWFGYSLYALFPTIWYRVFLGQSTRYSVHVVKKCHVFMKSECSSPSTWPLSWVRWIFGFNIIIPSLIDLQSGRTHFIGLLRLRSNGQFHLDRKVILKLKRQGVSVLTVFMWLRIRSSYGLLWTLMNLRVPYMAGDFVNSGANSSFSRNAAEWSE
jgi:hypothetical protein